MKLIRRIQEYYRNSPRRIGWTVFGGHCVLLLLAYIFLGLDLTEWGAFIPGILMTAVMVFLFPSTSFGIFDDVQLPSIVPALSFLMYYGLFFYMVYLARDTSKTTFIYIALAFSIWFFVSAVVSVGLLFDLGPI